MIIMVSMISECLTLSPSVWVTDPLFPRSMMTDQLFPRCLGDRSVIPPLSVSQLRVPYLNENQRNLSLLKLPNATLRFPLSLHFLFIEEVIFGQHRSHAIEVHFKQGTELQRRWKTSKNSSKAHFRTCICVILSIRLANILNTQMMKTAEELT